MAKTKSISVTLNELRISEIDRYVDGVTFRSRSHMIDTILNEWMEYQSKKGKGEQTTIYQIREPVKTGKKRNARK